MSAPIPPTVSDTAILVIADAVDQGHRGSVLVGHRMLLALFNQAVESREPWAPTLVRLVEVALARYERTFPAATSRPKPVGEPVVAD
ncbi:MAG: hypothetical protein K0Q72_1645 [Armatimonadetes bacterium]|jgi:hypothetical protein|nr:hypothetical protein [Armatimonadota bacterium]